MLQQEKRVEGKERLGSRIEEQRQQEPEPSVAACERQEREGERGKASADHVLRREMRVSLAHSLSRCEICVCIILPDS